MPSYEKIPGTFHQMKREVAGISAFVVLFVFQATPVRSSVVRAGEIESTGTVPFIFDDNRVFAELTFVKPNGALRKAVAYVDLGTPRMVIDRKLREELQPDQNKPLRLRLETWTYQSNRRRSRVIPGWV
jgi:hypothetical protein